MRIAYVINSLEGGGACAPVPAVAAVLQRHGAEVIVLGLTGRDRRGLAAIEAAGIPVRVRDGGEKDHAAALVWLGCQIADWRPDIVWTSLTRATLLGQIVAGRQGIPVVSWQHAAFLKPANRLLLRARQSRSALWIADSECVAALTARRLAVSPDRLVTWPLFAADADAPRAAPWRPDEPVRIGSLGRLHPVKGFDVLLRAIAPLQGRRTAFDLSIAGEGAERQALETMIARAGLGDVRLAGFTSDPRAFLAGLHLYLQPSRSEGLCIAAHEAMQAGLPVIASAVGEMPYTIVQRQTGWTVPPGDADALSFALAEALAHPERLAAIGDAARNRLLGKFNGDAFEAAGAAVMARVSALAAASAPHRSASRDQSDRSAWRRSA